MAIMGQLRLPRTTPMAIGMSLRQQVKGQFWANLVSLNSWADLEIRTVSRYAPALGHYGFPELDGRVDQGLLVRFRLFGLGRIWPIMAVRYGYP